MDVLVFENERNSNFLPLFELLKYFPGKLSLIPTVLLPGALFALTFLLPFFDRKAERNPLRRPIATAVFVFLLVGTVSLGALAKYQDHRNPEFNAKLKKQDEEARAFLKSPFEPQDIGSANKSENQRLSGTIDPIEPPAAFAQNLCANCHGDHGQGGKIGPRLVGVTSKPNRSKEDLLKLLDNTRTYGLKDPMPVTKGKLEWVFRAREDQLIARKLHPRKARMTDSQKDKQRPRRKRIGVQKVMLMGNAS